MIGFIHDSGGAYRPGFILLAVVIFVSVPLALGIEPVGRVSAKARRLARKNYRERNRFESSG